MTRTTVAFLAAAAGMLALAGSMSPAFARPPTVMHSPGYEARLAESRKAWAQYKWSLQTDQPAVRPLKTPRYYVRPAPRR